MDQLRCSLVALLLVGCGFDLDSLQECSKFKRCATPTDLQSAPADMTQEKPLGCAAGVGSRVGQGYACPALFSASNPASAQCAEGFSLCASSTQIDQAACRRLDGFFSAALYVKKSSTKFSCGVAIQAMYLAGCGADKRGTVIEVPGDQRCGGFEQVIDCNADEQWTCISAGIDASSQTAVGDGVLCCPK